MNDCKTCNGERVLFYHDGVCICDDCSYGMTLSNYIVSIRSYNKQLELESKNLKQQLKEANDLIDECFLNEINHERLIADRIEEYQWKYGYKKKWSDK
jgi:hypothetical protein